MVEKWAEAVRRTHEQVAKALLPLPAGGGVPCLSPVGLDGDTLDPPVLTGTQRQHVQVRADVPRQVLCQRSTKDQGSPIRTVVRRGTIVWDLEPQLMRYK